MIASRIDTAIRYAKNEGCLVCDIRGQMKLISAGTVNGQKRIKSIFKDNPNIIVGFYMVNDNFSEIMVKNYILEDAVDLI